MENFVTKILKPVAQNLYNLVCGVPPETAKYIFVAVIMLLGIWILTLKNESEDPETGKKYPIYKDLRTWAVLILLLQSAGYLILG
ncbi:MAG: hypothetical protein JXR91_09160 [Deltaproteobacteria bacterium]|nr:hypothetical protein [Deltaproteobacteria bacterium]